MPFANFKVPREDPHPKQKEEIVTPPPL